MLLSCAFFVLPAALPPLFKGIGDYHRHVTKSVVAQRYFDQGLAFLYGFNKPESFLGFSAAARLDPKCAMAWWGMAAAKAPDINSPEVTPEDSKIAIDALAKASALAGSATPADRALIAAEQLRFGDRPRSELNLAHATAMRQAWHRFPRDPDVGARFADALLNRRPWDQWLPNGTPQPGTLEATDVLGKVLALSPRHPLALHLTIHAWEASPHPERAAVAADRLRMLEPALGHMVHMPSHIDVRTGHWKEAIASNERGIRADLALRKIRPGFDPYLFYTAHNYHMLGFSAMMSGQRKKAIAAMDAVVGLVPTAMQKDLAPFIDGMYAMPYEARIRFGLWDEILAQPELPSYFPLANALRHAARGVAYAAKGDTYSADSEALEFTSAETSVKRDENYDHTPNGVILDIARSLLAGEILLARGKADEAIVELQKAVESENKVRYSEPPDWVLPTRHVLGVALLKAKMPVEAEQVYRESLRRVPNDGWALQGLSDALLAQNKMSQATAIRRRFAMAWADADTKIGSSCLCVPTP